MYFLPLSIFRKEWSVAPKIIINIIDQDVWTHAVFLSSMEFSNNDDLQYDNKIDDNNFILYFIKTCYTLVLVLYYYYCCCYCVLLQLLYHIWTFCLQCYWHVVVSVHVLSIIKNHSTRNKSKDNNNNLRVNIVATAAIVLQRVSSRHNHISACIWKLGFKESGLSRYELS